jgi:hypothetical protein
MAGGLSLPRRCGFVTHILLIRIHTVILSICIWPKIKEKNKKPVQAQCSVAWTFFVFGPDRNVFTNNTPCLPSPVPKNPGFTQYTR